MTLPDAITPEVLLTIRDWAVKFPSKETCGIIDTKGNVYRIANVATIPAIHFLFDRREYFHALRAIMEAGAEMLCVFHTHPSGDHSASKADLKAIQRFKRHSLIVSSKGYTWLEYA